MHIHYTGDRVAASDNETIFKKFGRPESTTLSLPLLLRMAPSSIQLREVGWWNRRAHGKGSAIELMDHIK